MVKRAEDQPTDRFIPIKPSSEKDKSGKFREDDIDTLLKEGIMCFEKREFPKAIELFEKVLRIDPNNITAYEKITIARSVQADIESIKEYMAIGREYMKQNQWEKAADEFNAVLTIDGNHEEAKMLLAQVEEHIHKEESQEQYFPSVSDDEEDEETLLIRDYDGEQSQIEIMAKAEAALDMENIIPSGEKDEKDIFKLDKEIEKAISFYEKGELEKAKNILLELSKDHPDHTQISYYLQIIESKFKEGQSSEDQSKVENLLKEGMDELEKKKYSSAMKCFKEALRLKPDFKQAELMLEKARSMVSKTNSISASTYETKAGFQRKKIRKPQDKSDYKVPKSNLSKYIIVVIGAAALASIAYFFLIKYPEIQIRHYFNEAKRMMEENEFKIALDNIKKIESLEPDNIEAYALDGEINMKMHNGKAAAFAYQKLLSLNPDQEIFILKLGDAYFLQGNYGSAEKQYYLATKNTSIAVEAFYKLGLSQIKMNKVEDAIISFEKAIRKNPDFSSAHYQLARLMERTGRLEQAEKEYLLAIEKDSRNTDAYWSLGNFYANQKQYDQAIEIYSQALQWINASTFEGSKLAAKFRLALGKMYYETGEYQKALEQYNKVMMIQENNPDVYDESGRAYFKLGKYQPAIVAWKKAISLAPDRDDFHYRIGTVYHKMGNLKGAKEEYLEAVKLNNQNAKALRNLGFVYYHQYEYDRARNAWERSLAVDPNQALVRKKLKEINSSK